MTSPAVTWFSTRGVPPERRTAAWESHNDAELVSLAARTRSGAPLHAEELTVTLPRLRVARVAATSHDVSRSAAHIAEAPVDGLVAYLALRGTSTFEVAAGRTVLSPGSMIVVDGDTPFRRSFPRGLAEYVVTMPRDSLPAVLAPDAGCRRGVASVDLRSPGRAAVAGAHLARLASAVTGRPALADADLQSRMLDCLRSLLDDEQPEAASLHAARTVIAERFPDPELGAEEIAAAINVSVRQLSRIFARSGQSVPQAIREARMRFARSRLSSPEHAGLALGEIAEQSGFRSLAHFSRTYRAQFGCSPSDHRLSPHIRHLTPSRSDTRRSTR
ncbi:helix-turn-helix domain-containing protein [Herbiconiux sp. CPCC 203407]|uniref:Helix-turn-helix domain-containing protein n=1 Tax=Herbiconiux oxytropis TaxID=2970915 RepID=A0AA42BV02_9MICO|nr:helix-turn-helix domain-containing protein [Herbiconiux oxytropis]MCS5723536.1 helix-turn-helix domain-containing protein [Herbiconiux oxytropis]MCS5727462.1 helix-turn-helix domain-containing protein [Herbiconiux oxytropis]